MLKYLLLLAILPLLLIPIYSEELYGQLSDVSIIVTTDKSFYPVNETIFITGEVRDLYSGMPVSIIIIAPNENLVAILQISVNDDKTFSMEYTLGGSLMKAEGVYIVTAQYGNEKQLATTSFNYMKIPDSITITTDKSSYIQGDLIFISGQFSNLPNGTSIHISLDPSKGFIFPVRNITINNNSFNATINTENNTQTWWLPGTYTLTSHYGITRATTTFDYSYPIQQEDNEYFIPPSEYLILSDREISKWNHQIEKWENKKNSTDNRIDSLYDKLDRAITRNQTDKIERWTEEIGHSMALSSLYDGLIECLQEELQLLS